MALRKWDLFDDITGIREEFHKLFSEMFGRPYFQDFIEERCWLPPLDIMGNEEEIIITVEVPGISEDDISISLAEKMLTIKGRKEAQSSIEDRVYYRSECPVGPFKRVVSLPEGFEIGEIEAIYKYGVLKITISKAKPKK